MTAAARKLEAVEAWWPDWRGDRVAIIAGGPSAKHADLALLRGKVKVVAIKEAIELCPWADAVYGCDGHWWKHRRGLPTFAGLKFAYANEIAFPGIHPLRIVKTSDDLLMDEPGLVGSGGNSGFHVVNATAQWGVVGQMLIGFDMNDRAGVHWYGRNGWPNANNPGEDNFRRWRKAFMAAAPKLASLGIDVVNVSKISTLQCFRRAGIDQAMTEWGLA
jgi:hypothetical protein